MKQTVYLIALTTTCSLLIAGQGSASKHSVEPHTPPHTSSKGSDGAKGNDSPKAPDAPAAEPEVGAKVIQYGDKDIVRLKTKLRYTTLIVLPKTEQILDFACGDKDLWVVNGNQNFAYVKPAKTGAQTNLNLVTASCNIYSFALIKVSESSDATPDLKVFVEPKEESMISAASASPRFVSAQEVEDYKQQVAIAKEETRQAKEACQAAIDAGITKFLANMRFPYRFEAGKKPFFVRAMYQDDKFTYIQARPEETPALYEVLDGKPNLINFDYRNGVYIAEKILDQGYLAIEKKKLNFTREQ
jgi:type IV secretory pathway VirB9-like protein